MEGRGDESHEARGSKFLESERAVVPQAVLVVSVARGDAELRDAVDAPLEAVDLVDVPDEHVPRFAHAVTLT